MVTEKRTYQFCVANATDRDHWIQKIREVVDEKWDAHKIAKPSISYTATQLPNEAPLSSGKPGNFAALQTQNKPKKKNKNKNQNINTQKYGYNNNAYSNDEDEEEWDDDDEPHTSNGATWKIKNNLLADQNNGNDDHLTSGTYNDDAKEDRYSHRIKSKRRNQQNQEMLTEQEAKEQIQELENKNIELLDEALQISYETQRVANDTAEALNDQGHQLRNIDKNLHELDQDLDRTEGILDGMKSWGGMLKRKLKGNKKAARDTYQAPVSDKSTFERRENLNGNNNNNNYNNGGMVAQVSGMNMSRFRIRN